MLCSLRNLRPSSMPSALIAISYRVTAFEVILVQSNVIQQACGQPTFLAAPTQASHCSPHSLGLILLRAIRSFTPDTHRRSTGDSALPTSPSQCITEQETRHSRLLLAHCQSGGPNFDARQRRTVIQAYRPASNLRGSYV